MQSAPATGPLCQMHWQLLQQNRHMPHRFFLTDSGAVLKLSGRRATLCGVPQTSEEGAEIQDFLVFSNADRLTAVDWYAPGWILVDNAAVMRRSANAPLPPVPPVPGFDPEVPVNDVLDVLESSSGPMEPEGVREGFWVDFHIRRNHGYSRVYGVWEGDVLAATAGAYAVLDKTAYIACVETRPESRGKGYATALLAQLCADLPEHDISLLCRDELCGFYAPLGFAKTGQHGFICQTPA